MALALRQPAQSSQPRCKFCKRTLTDERSIARGAGDECAGKLAQMMAAVDAGLATENTIGDYKLHTLGARLRQLQRIEVVKPNSAKLQDDLHTARANYARRVEYLASQGFLTIPEVSDLPANAPHAPAPDATVEEQEEQADSSTVREFPSEYELACAAVQAAEADYQREYENPHSTRFVEACLTLQEARRDRAQAALAEIQSRGYCVRRTSYTDGASTLMKAPDALAQIAYELRD